MGRKSTFNATEIFEVVGRRLAHTGSVTLRDVVADTGVSIGSLYHRFGSREDLLALTWLDAVEAFQRDFLTALNSGDDDAGEQAAMATPRFCRAYPARAWVLVCCRREELIQETISTDIAARIKDVNLNVSRDVARFAKTKGYSLEACKLGLVGFPLGAVQQYLPHALVPRHLDVYIAAAFRTTVGLGI